MRKGWLLVMCVHCTRVPVSQLAITAVEPREAAMGAPAELRITGVDFLPQPFISYLRSSDSALNMQISARLGDHELSDVTLIDRETLTATAPPLPVGTYDLTVQRPDGATTTLLAAFSVVSPSTLPSGTGATDPCVGVTSPACTLVGWQYKRKIVFNVTQTVAPLTVLVALDNTNIDYSKTTGADLRFLDADEITRLPHEIERWQPGGRSIVWVRVPQIDAGNSDHMWMVYGNSGATAPTNASSTWSDGFDGVWHLESLRDSTGRLASDLLPLGSAGPQAGPVATTGQLAGARRFDGVDDALFVGSNLPLLNAASAVSFSAWVYLESSGVRQMMAVGRGDMTSTALSRGSVGIDASNHVIIDGRTRDIDDAFSPYPLITSTATLGAGSWHYVATSQDLVTDTTLVYIDGIDAGHNAGAYTDLAFPNSPAYTSALGSQDNTTSGDFWHGLLDEVRLSRSFHSAAWIAADYRSVTHQLCTFEAEQTRP